MNVKGKLILSILIILIIAIAVVTGILYFTTDLLRPNEYVFQKYFLQNFVNISKVIDVNYETKIVEYILKNDYTTQTNGTLSYKEKENDQEENYNIKEQGIVNNTKKSAYRRINAKFGKEELLNLDILNIDDTYGAKFTDITQKFIVIENPINSLLQTENDFLQKIDSKNIAISELLNFSQSELAQIQKKYSTLIFQDLDKESYSKKKNAIITSQTEAGKIYKRILNQIAEDEILLSKLEKIGEEFKEKIILNIKKTADSIEYSGKNEKELSVDVFVANEVMVRTAYKTQDMDYIIDYDYSDGIKISLQTIKPTNEGEDKTVYSFGKKSKGARSLEYKDSSQSINLNYDIQSDEQKIDINTSFELNNENINELKLELNTNIDFANTKDFQNKFTEQNSIDVNDYEKNEIEDILKKLKDAEIKFLEKKQSKINTKLLNNILLWIDNKEKIKDQQEMNKQNEEVNKFNNMFKLFEGENIDYETISKLLETVGENFKDFEVVDGKHIKLLIEPNSTNKEKFEKIKNAISNKYKYNVNFKYDSNGYINVINISIYEKK